MKKVIKNISRILCSILLVLSVIGIINVLASEPIFKITKIEVKEKSDKATVNNVSVSGGTINNDIIFTDKDDYITYNITIKNNTSDDYTIKSISDDNDSEYLKYTYDDLSDIKIEAGKEKIFTMTITYIKESSDLTVTDKSVNLTLAYEGENGSTGTETITTKNKTSNNSEIKNNPKTGDNITLYIILSLVSITGLVITTVSKKHVSKVLTVITVASLLLIPLGTKADSDKFIIKFDNDVKDAQFNVLYDANGGSFSDGSTVKQVPYRYSEPSTDVYISHTENVDDTGKQLSDYDDYWDNENIVGTNRGDSYENHVITVDGAVGLIVDVY